MFLFVDEADCVSVCDDDADVFLFVDDADVFLFVDGADVFLFADNDDVFLLLMLICFCLLLMLMCFCLLTKLICFCLLTMPMCFCLLTMPMCLFVDDAVSDSIEIIEDVQQATVRASKIVNMETETLPDVLLSGFRLIDVITLIDIFTSLCLLCLFFNPFHTIT